MPDSPLDQSEELVVSDLPTGTYQVSLRVEDLDGISDPMFLAIEGRDANGKYPLGSFSVEQ